MAALPSSVTIPPSSNSLIHFMNSAFSEPGTFSCAVDVFLEISHFVIFPLLSDLQRSIFWDVLYAAISDYKQCISTGICSSFDDMTRMLTEIRQPVWDRLKILCPSFQQMDNNAQFSQIFQLRNFELTTEEKNLFLTRYSHESFCDNCQKSVTTQSDIFVHYLTLTDMLKTGVNILDWPLYIELRDI